MGMLELLLLPAVLTINNHIVKIDNHRTLISIETTEESQQILDLSGLGIKRINNGVFDNLSYLRYLSLANNSLTSESGLTVNNNGIFSNLINLEYLSLAMNQLYDYENIFRGLRNLKTLDISRNSMKIPLVNVDFSALPKSCYILTEGTLIESINTDAFAAVPRETKRKQKYRSLMTGIEQYCFGSWTKYDFAYTSPDEKDLEAERQIKCPQFDFVRRGLVDLSVPNVPPIDADYRVKICIENGNVTLLDFLNNRQVLSNECRELMVDRRYNFNLHNQQLVVKRELSLANLGIVTFAKNWYKLQGVHINSIDLSGNNIVRITRQVLNDLPVNIRYVNLSGNKIERLERGIIANKYLRYLDLNDNHIGVIEDEAFKKTMLSALSANGNSLGDTGFVATLPSSLTEFYLRRNLINEIYPNSFARLGQLSYLDLSENYIFVLRSQALRGLTSLRQLLLVDNGLQIIENGAFQDLGFLQSLDFARNRFTSPQNRVFAGLNSLLFLYLNENKLTYISPGLLEGLPNTLRVIRMDNNLIEIVTTGTFTNVPKYNLVLNNNKLQRINKDTFSLTSLQWLHLENNEIRKIEKECFNLPNLRKLNLRMNKIESIEKGSMSTLALLENLDIRNNSLNSLNNGALFGIPYSRKTYVNFGTAHIQRIQAGVFDDS